MPPALQYPCKCKAVARCRQSAVRLMPINNTGSAKRARRRRCLIKMRRCELQAATRSKAR
ncbi:hypothetical protein CH063_08808 [Colletotrichum higginsianum]|uniref:Uncharacterized protein n=1 Tax=Colletotrichum higginsianum (strain IMI 349063) TaxID=759273 RepID=H1VB40_COLHI|nr:hypothetical protein CH063_08808 [Colletotrichum higginsianum]